MQMQVIVSACFSLYTYESNPGVAHITATSIAHNSLFHHKQQPFQPQPKASSTAINNHFDRHYINFTPPKHLIAHPFRHLFIIRAIPFRSINALTALKRSSIGKYHNAIYLLTDTK